MHAESEGTTTSVISTEGAAWDILSGRVIHTVDMGQAVNDLAVSHDGKLIAVARDSKSPITIMDFQRCAPWIFSRLASTRYNS